MTDKVKEWQTNHGNFIHAFLLLLNKQTDQFVLKGGTALSLCYGLDRFSEDIDLDGRKQDIKEIVKRFSGNHGISYRVAKDTPTVKRCIIDYGNNLHPLKIEVSYRNKNLDLEEASKDWTQINGIKVYGIDALARMKAMAYQGRDKIRDLYDLSFIVNNFYDDLSHQSKGMIRDTLSYKGIEQFDYLVATQQDPLIDKDRLAEGFLKMHEKLGLLMDKEEQEIQSKVESKVPENEK